MKIFMRVSAQEFLAAGAPLTAIRQSYRKYDNYVEKTVARTETLPNESGSGTSSVTDAATLYESSGSSRDTHFYFVPALNAKTKEHVTAIASGDTLKLVWGGSIKDSYVSVTSA